MAQSHYVAGEFSFDADHFGTRGVHRILDVLRDAPLREVSVGLGYSLPEARVVVVEIIGPRRQTTVALPREDAVTLADFLEHVSRRDGASPPDVDALMVALREAATAMDTEGHSVH